MAKLLNYSSSYKPHPNVQKVTISGRQYRVTKFNKDGIPMVYILLIDIDGLYKEIDIRKLNGFFDPPQYDLISYFQKIVTQQNLTIKQINPF